MYKFDLYSFIGSPVYRAYHKHAARYASSVSVEHTQSGTARMYAAFDCSDNAYMFLSRMIRDTGVVQLSLRRM